MDRHVDTEARYLTVGEVAALFRVSSMTVYRLINAGELPAVRIGRSFRLREEDLDRYLAERADQGRLSARWSRRRVPVHGDCRSCPTTG